MPAKLPNERESGGVAIPLSKHSLLSADNSVDFGVIDAHAEYVINKIARGFDNHDKNSGTTHDDSATREPGAGIPLLTDKKMMWYGSITIGTPPKSFFVIFDTGSSDLALPAAACDASCEGHTRWDPVNSATKHPSTNKCEIKYGGGTVVNGDKYTDNVTVAGFTAKTQTLCAATSYPPRLAFEKFPPDGVMGMAFPSISTNGASPVFATLVNENAVVNKVFSFNLSSDGGQLYIGGANRELYRDELVHTPVIEERYWKVQVESIRGKKTTLNNVDAILDTGATYIAGDTSRVRELHDALGGQYYDKGFYMYYCDTFPDIVFTFNGKEFTISGSTHKLGPAGPGSDKCWSGIIAKEALPSNSWILGGVFLQNVYVSFDYGNKRVGFAEHA